jgi:hypothetical protein
MTLKSARYSVYLAVVILVVGWIAISGMEFSVMPLSEARVYGSPYTNEVAETVPASAALEVVECIETGSDFYYLIRTRSGNEGYVFDLRMRYESAWRFPSFNRLLRGPLYSLSCMSMKQRWGV